MTRLCSCAIIVFLFETNLTSTITTTNTTATTTTWFSAATTTDDGDNDDYDNNNNNNNGNNNSDNDKNNIYGNVNDCWFWIICLIMDAPYALHAQTCHLSNRFSAGKPEKVSELIQVSVFFSPWVNRSFFRNAAPKLKKQTRPRRFQMTLNVFSRVSRAAYLLNMIIVSSMPQGAAGLFNAQNV